MYVGPNGELIGVNAHPGNYGNLRGLGDDGDDEGENEDAMGMGVGSGMPYGLGAFLDLKTRVPSSSKPKLPVILPTYASERAVYPDRGVAVAPSRFNPAQRRFKGGV